MRIGEIAQRSGIPAHTIRFYETQQLVTRAARNGAGYRVYSDQVLDELGFIRRAQRLGFSLDEIRQILSLGRGGKIPCARVAALCTSHLAEIDQRMAELRAFRSNLRTAQRQATAGCGFTSEGFCRAIMGPSISRRGSRQRLGPEHEQACTGLLACSRNFGVPKAKEIRVNKR